MVFVEDTLSSLSENIRTIIDIKDRNQGVLTLEKGELVDADTQSLSQRLQVKIDNRLEVLRKKAYHLEEQIDGLRQERLVMSQVETETKVERKENKHG